MKQFDVVNVKGPDSARVVVLQTDLMADSPTVVVAPIIPKELFGRTAPILNPVFHLNGKAMALSTQELAAVSRPTLGDSITSLAEERETIIAAIDLLFTGI